MSLKDHGIEYVTLEKRLIASRRLNPKNRAELGAMRDDFIRTIPGDITAGSLFFIFRYVSSVSEGYDVEICIPVSRDFSSENITSRVIPEMGVLKLVHTGPADELSGSYRTLYSTAYEHGLISDEFGMEVYPDHGGDEGRIELLFVIHDWGALLKNNTERVLGASIASDILVGMGNLSVESYVVERYQWVKEMLSRMERFADDRQTYDILSSCAHIFPEEPIQGMRDVYKRARKKGGDALDAVDTVINHMRTDSAFGEAPYREGMILFASKGPYDKKGYEEAKTVQERRRASCFCPVIRNNLDGGMPVSYCNCGAGWYRRQWEGVFGKPVYIEVIKSVLNGDDYCEFAIHIPEML